MNSVYWAWALKNSVVIICWTALAVFFGKWWIALFAAFFVSDLKRTTSTGEKEKEADHEPTD